MSLSDDLVLSDVHLSKVTSLEEVVSLDGIATYCTNFNFSCPAELLHKVRGHLHELVDSSCNRATLDHDGDIILPRRRDFVDSIDLKHGLLVLRIHHSMATQLRDVGMQVWTAALLMVDFILYKSEYFMDKRVLELGGGAGIPSLIAGMIAKTVTVTDTGKSVLRLCEMNYQANKHLTCCSEESFVVQELDWFGSDETEKCYSYDCIIACDMVYDNDLTDAFFRTVHNIISNSKLIPTVYITLEKRLNFTVAELDVTCKEYDHFRLCLRQLKATLDAIEVYEINTNTLSQHSNYRRTAQLELWVICKTT